MRCLLCNRAIGPLAHLYDDVWSFTCGQCGPYLFDTPFAECVSRIRATRVTASLETLHALGRRLADATELPLVTMSLYRAVADELAREQSAQPAAAAAQRPIR